MTRRFRKRFRRFPGRALSPAGLSLAGFAGALLRHQGRKAAQPEAVDDDYPEPPRRRFYYRKHRRFF